MRNTGTLLICVGALAMLFGLSGPGAAPLAAQPLPERPTLTPAPPTPAPDEDDDEEEESEAPAAGRITGTVIDLATGAPAPGVTVVVGDAPVVSDANGNYDRSGLPPGDYTITLIAPDGRGAPAQPPATVALAAGETLVRHLAFGSAPATPTPQAEAPAALPRTGGGEAASLLWLALGVALALTGGALAGAARREPR